MSLSFKNLSTATKITLGVSAGALVLGLAMGYGAAASDAKQVAAPAAADPVTITKTEEVIKTVVPDSCTAALGSADELNTLVELTFDDLSGGMNAIATGDFAENDRLVAKITNRTSQIKSAKISYNGFAAGCRSESQQ